MIGAIPVAELLRYVPDKLFFENSIVRKVSKAIAPLREEEAALKRSTGTTFGSDSHVRSNQPLTTSKADDIKTTATGESFVGTLTIKSHKKFGTGHSWLEISDPEGHATTWASWGYRPVERLKELTKKLMLQAGVSEDAVAKEMAAVDDGALRQRGVFQGGEVLLHSSSQVSRSVKLDAFAAQRLAKSIEVFLAQGEHGWSPAVPCSAFASIVWEATTGERLVDQNLFGVSLPPTLSESIVKANGDHEQGVLTLGAAR